MKTKTITLLLLLFISTAFTASNNDSSTHYYYIFAACDTLFEDYAGDDNYIHIYSNIVRTNKSEYENDILAQFGEAMAVKYKTYLRCISSTRGPFDSEGEAAKYMRKSQGTDNYNNQEYITFTFSYYED